MLTEKFCSYLLGAKIHVYTSSRNSLFWQAAQWGAIEQKWLAQLSMFDFTIHHKPCKHNIVADYLSSHLVDKPGTLDEEDGDVPLCSINATRVPGKIGLRDFRVIQDSTGALNTISETEYSFFDDNPIRTILLTG